MTSSSLNMEMSGRWAGVSSRVVPRPTLGLRHLTSTESTLPFSSVKKTTQYVTNEQIAVAL